MSHGHQFVCLLRHHTVESRIFLGFVLLMGCEAVAFPAFLYSDVFRLNLGLTFVGFELAIFAPFLAALFLFAAHFENSEYLKRISEVSGGNEFLLTRAIDRETLFWTRLIAYWIMVFFPVLVSLGLVMIRPFFSLEPFPKEIPRYLSNLPGAVLQEGTDRILVPQGNVMLFSVTLPITILFGSIWLTVASVIAPSRYGMWLMGGILVCGFAIFILSLTHFLPFAESLLFFGMKHPWSCLLASIATVPFAAIFSKRRFLDQEF